MLRVSCGSGHINGRGYIANRLFHSQSQSRIESKDDTVLLQSKQLKPQFFSIEEAESAAYYKDRLTLQALKYRGRKLPRIEDTEFDKINSSKSLPQIQLIKPMSEIVANIRPGLNSTRDLGLKDKGKAYYGSFKNYLSFFKAGILNIWSLNKFLRKEVYNKKRFVIETGIKGNGNDVANGNAKDRKIALKRGNLHDVVDELAITVRCIENEAQAKNSPDEPWNDSDADRKIQLSRSEFQLMIRNGYDLPRLPLFGLLFFVIEEFSLPLYYLFPFLMPSTCVFPAFMPRYYSGSLKAERKLIELRQGKSYEDVGSLNPYNMSDNEVKLVCDYLHIAVDPFSRLFTTSTRRRELLMDRYKELTVDNYLLLRDGGIYRLNKLELMAACVRRGLLNYEQLLELMKDKSLDNVAHLDKVDGEQLRDSLLRFVLDFGDRRNHAGLLGMYTTVER